jgi:hypothetical protein
VRIGRRVFQGLLDQSPTPERCIEAFHLQRTRFEMIAELRRRQLADDGNVEVTGRDLSRASAIRCRKPNRKSARWLRASSKGD